MFQDDYTVNLASTGDRSEYDNTGSLAKKELTPFLTPETTPNYVN